MSLTFRDVTEDNFIECVRLSVRDDQRFVAPNVFSIAQSKVEPKWITKTIYSDDAMVGFLMYEVDHSKGQLYLCRLMVDQKFQRKGYGKGALDLLREIAIGDPKIARMELSTRPDNTDGIRVYERFGFKDTGVMDDDEEVFVLELQK